MSPVQRFRLVCAPVLVGAAMLAACNQNPIAPATERASFEAVLPNAAAFQGGCQKHGDGVVADDLHHFPVGKAELAVGEDGNLVVSHLRKNGSDGVCTVLPQVGGVAVDVQGIAIHEMGHTLIAQNGKQVYEAGLRFSAGQGSRMDGFMDFAGHCAVTVVLRRNGEVIRSRTGAGRISFELPGSFQLSDWGFKDGIAMLRGRINGDDMMSVIGTPDASCRAMPVLREAFNYISQPNNDGVVLLSWATFPSD